MEHSYQHEIEELHQFFQDWFNGAIPDSDASFARFSDVMAADFEMVVPNGRSISIASLQPALRQRYNSWQNGRIWIKNVRLHWQKGDVLLVTYEEWQVVDGEENGRLSSVLFQSQLGLPHDLLWLHVHETWLPFTKLELQFYNIRHVMQHTGELSGRLFEHEGIEINWVGMQS